MLNSSILNSVEFVGGLRISRFLNRNVPRILMYHRVVEDVQVRGISPVVFDQQLTYLKKHFRVISVERLINEVQCGGVKPYTLAVTFDDGHSDFYSNAWPLLKKHNLPATLYITTGFVDSECWLWPDLLHYLLIRTSCSSVEIPDLGVLSLDAREVLTSWNTLGDYCLQLETTVRTNFLRDLAYQLKVTAPNDPQEPFAPLTWNQLREMHNEGLCVGSHSVSHPILSTLPESQLLKELIQSRQRINDELGELPTGICYPNGMARDVSDYVERQAQQFYRYGLVAYPTDVHLNRIMHLGRWAAPHTMLRFKQMINGLSRNDNHRGEYR